MYIITLIQANEMMHCNILKSTECNVLRKIFWLKRKREAEVENKRNEEFHNRILFHRYI